ncbi:MAG: hypothetical protein AAGC78_14970 [Cellvibrio sp.]|uniref:hypothetical protein n=1 Tax=Cellvibrio sp. TaxID=1965322 RepID=UPI0031A853C8
MNFEEEMEKAPLTQAEEDRIFSAQVPLYEKAVLEMRNTSGLKERHSAIPQAAKAAYMLGLFPEAKEWAEEMSELIKIVPKNWNYGNVIYYQNWVFGMLAFDSGDLDKAKYFLNLAASTVGSPQLNSFGPNMKLARNLLVSGESEAFLEFLNQVEIFWRHGKPWLEVWRNKVAQGAIPNCTMHIS